MRYEFKPSFDRSIRPLSPEAKDQIKLTCLCFIDLLELKVRLPLGIGLKHLQNDFWEVRKGLQSRILFRWRNDHIEFIITGSHDEIKKFLKNA
ncbi:MAG: hypothetical protein ACYDH0_02655 [Candidatus Aminicenantales bacterium]